MYIPPNKSLPGLKARRNAARAEYEQKAEQEKQEKNLAAMRAVAGK